MVAKLILLFFVVDKAVCFYLTKILIIHKIPISRYYKTAIRTRLPPDVEALFSCLGSGSKLFNFDFSAGLFEGFLQRFSFVFGDTFLNGLRCTVN